MTLRVVARAHLEAAVLLTCSAAIAFTWLIGSLQTLVSADGSWAGSAPAVALALWLPGIIVALRLREVWPALGPGDAGRGFVHVHARSLATSRFGAAAGAILALTALQLLTGAVAGGAVAAIRGFPGFSRSRVLDATPTGTILVRSGQAVRVAVPEHTESRLELVPRYYFAKTGLREAIDLVVEGPGFRRRVTLPDFGARVTAAIPSSPAPYDLKITRASSGGPPISLTRGRITLLSRNVHPVLAMVRLSSRHLPWAILLVSIAFAASAFVAREVHLIVVLALAPVLAAVPRLTPATGRLVAAARVPAIELPSPMIATTAVALLGVLLGLGTVARRGARS